MPNIPYVQSVNRNYREALDSVFDILSDKISRPPVQNHDPDDCSDLYPDKSKSSPMSLPISSRLSSSFRMSDAYLSVMHSRSPPVGASQTKLRKLGIFPNKPLKLSFARYKPMASDVWDDLLKDPDQRSGLPSHKKEIYLSRHIAHALDRSLRSDLMILNSLDLFCEALSINHSNLVKLVDQTDSQLSLDIQQALEVNSVLINQLKFHLIDLLVSITHSISTLTLARRDSFLSTVPKHVPDHIVRELRSHPIYGPTLFSESSLKALQSRTKEYKQEQFQSALTKGVSNQLSASASRGKSFKRPKSQDKDSQDRKIQNGSGSSSFQGPVNLVVESLPGVGERSLNLNLNNDVLQEVGVTLVLSKVPLIPPDPSTMSVGGRLGHFHLNWNFLGAHLSVIKNLEFGHQLPVGSVRIPLSRVPLIGSHYSSSEKNVLSSSFRHVAQRSNSRSQGSIIPGFLQQTLFSGKEDRRMEASNRF